MESRIKLKVSRREMEDLLDNANEMINIKYCEEIKEGLWKVVIRHQEFPEYLNGTFTIDKLENTLKELRELNNLLKKGDIVKTSLSDSTVVLKVEGNDALLFSGRQFVVAHGVQKENDYVFWGQGEYYDELPDNIFDKSIRNHQNIREAEENEGIDMKKYTLFGTLPESGARHSAEAESKEMAEILKIAMGDSGYEDLEIIDEDDWELEP